MSTANTSTRELIEQRIAEIDDALSSGIASVTTDGTSTSVNLAELRKERGRLTRRLSNMRRPLSMVFDLSRG